MKYWIGILLVCFTFNTQAQKTLPVISLEQLNAKTINTSDTLYVVNFWATWCKPCVAEMPYFETVGTKYAAQNVKLLFVSLDSPRDTVRVTTFLTDKQIQNEAALLSAGNPNVWIDKITPEWGGSIPATVMYKKGKIVFFKEGEFTLEELENIIKTKIE